MGNILLSLALGSLNILKLAWSALAKVANSLNAQGWVGLAGIAVLGVLLVIQKGETRHWRKQSAGFEQLYRAEVVAHAGTVANYRAAAEQARQADLANARRVEAEAAAQHQRSSHDYEVRIADARARADRLRQQLTASAADSGGGPGAPVPGLSAAAAGDAEAAGQDGLSVADRLTATEQAIQLDELIKWVRRIAAIDVNGAAAVGLDGPRNREPPDGQSKP